MLSLKSFHIFFISLSILVTGGYGIWQLQNPSINSGLSNLLGAIVIVMGISLAIYLQKVIQKFKTI